MFGERLRATTIPDRRPSWHQCPTFSGLACQYENAPPHRETGRFDVGR